MQALQDELRALERSHEEDMVHFRSDIACLAASIRRCIQLGLASAPRSRLLMRLHGALTAECHAQEVVDAVNERIRKVAARVGGLDVRKQMRAIEAEGEGMKAVVEAFVQLSVLQVKRQGRERELEVAGKRRKVVEEELKALGGCHCHEGMCARCLELLRVCEECVEVVRMWEEVVAVGK
jgi:hypothetical protein